MLPFMILLMCFSGALQGHDLWLEKEGGAYVLLYGHIGASHEGAESIEYPPDHVLRVDCFSREGLQVDTAFEPAYPVRINADCAAIFVLFSSGCWSRTPFGTKNLPKDEAISPIRSWISYESVKRIASWADRFSKPLTQDLELTPVYNPLELTKGRKARLLISLDGNPVEGAAVSYDGKIRGQSDEAGRVNIRLRHAGLQVIQASYTEPADSAKADEIIHTATLIFQIEADG
jgi:nickel transport protein